MRRAVRCAGGARARDRRRDGTNGEPALGAAWLNSRQVGVNSSRKARRGANSHNGARNRRAQRINAACSGFELQRDELPLDVPNKINFGTQCSGPLFSFSGVDDMTCALTVAMHCADRRVASTSAFARLMHPTRRRFHVRDYRFDSAPSARVLAANAVRLPLDGLTASDGQLLVSWAGYDTMIGIVPLAGTIALSGTNSETMQNNCTSLVHDRSHARSHRMRTVLCTRPVITNEVTVAAHVAFAVVHGEQHQSAELLSRAVEASSRIAANPREMRRIVLERLSSMRHAKPHRARAVQRGGGVEAAEARRGAESRPRAMSSPAL